MPDGHLPLELGQAQTRMEGEVDFSGRHRRQAGNLFWLVLVATVTAAIPVVLYVTLTRDRGPQDAGSSAVATTVTEDLDRLGEQEPLYRDAVTATLGHEPVIEAVDLRKEPGASFAQVRRVQLHLAPFFTARKAALDNVWSQVFAALPPGAGAMRTDRLVLVLGAAHAADVMLPEMVGEVVQEEGSVRVAGRWQERGQDCQAELTYTLHRGLLFVRFDCPGSRFPAAFLPAGYDLQLDHLSISSGSYLEMTNVALLEGEAEASVFRAQKMTMSSGAPVDRGLFASGLAAQRLARERQWSVSFEALDLTLSALGVVPLFGQFGTLPDVRFTASSATLSSSGAVVFVAPETAWPGVGELSAQQVDFATDGQVRRLTFTSPVVTEARWGISVAAPVATLERDGVGTYHLAANPFTIALPGNPLRLAALLQEGSKLKELAQVLRTKTLTLPSLALPAWLPDSHVRLAGGTLALPMGGSGKVTDIEVETDVRGGMLERLSGQLCMGRECGQLGLGVTFATDAAGNPERLVVKAKGARIAALISEQAHEVVQGLGGIDVDCTLTRNRGSGTYKATCKIALEKLTVAHAKLSENPFTFNQIGLEGEALVNTRDKTLELSLPKLQVGAVYFRVALDVARYDGLPEVDLKIDMPEQSCAELLAAVPERFAPNLQDARLTGSIWFSLAFKVDLKDVRKSIKIDVDGDLERCDAVTLGPRFDVTELNSPSYVHRVVVHGEDLGIDVGPGTAGYVPLDQIPKVVQAAAYGTEDLAFFRHNGFRLGLIRRAIILYLERGYYAYGGSTISQQLVKNLYLTRTKTISRKFEEAVIVWKMEKEVSKERIFELYLNCIEYGPRIWGIAKAARTYFGKHPTQLHGMEAAFIMGLKPDPGYGYLQFRRGRLNKHWRKNLERVVKRLLDMGAISAEKYDLYMRSRLIFKIPGAVPAADPDEDRPVRVGQEGMEEL